MVLYRNRQGEPIDLAEWVSLFEQHSYCIIKQTPLSKKSFISTVWIGIATPFDNIFETMYVHEDGKREWQQYATEQEAIEGHDAWIARIEASHDLA